MIRINLLPIKKQRAVASGRNIVVLSIALLVVEIGAIALIHIRASSQVQQLVRANQEIRTRIDRIKAEISDHETIRQHLDQIQGRDQIITKLQAARTGPVFALMELAGILSPGMGPRVPQERLEQMRRDNPLTAPNERWDTRRLWVTELTEHDRNVKIKGQARGHDDVAEFFRRLRVSEYFTNEQAPRTRTIDNAALHMELVEFEIQCTARYQ